MELRWYQWVGFLIFFIYSYLNVRITTGTPREYFIIYNIMVVIGFLMVLLGWFETRKNKEKNNKRSKWKTLLYILLNIVILLLYIVMGLFLIMYTLIFSPDILRFFR